MRKRRAYTTWPLLMGRGGARLSSFPSSSLQVPGHSRRPPPERNSPSLPLRSSSNSMGAEEEERSRSRSKPGFPVPNRGFRYRVNSSSCPGATPQAGQISPTTSSTRGGSKRRLRLWIAAAWRGSSLSRRTWV